MVIWAEQGGTINHFEILIPAQEKEIFRVTDDIAEILTAQDFSPETTRDLCAAVKEVMTNIIRHGYRERPGSIGICCTALPEKVSVEISDSAPAFNPLSVPDTSGSFCSPDAGGIGIAFVRQAADFVTYRHKNHRNILTLVKIKRR